MTFADLSPLIACALLLGIAAGAIGYLLGRGDAALHFSDGWKAGYAEARSWTNCRVIRGRMQSFKAGVEVGLKRFSKGRN